ncbi:tyrosine-protein phosphatase [Nocardia sp. NPDC049190]|uniref:tyrosine-protein phosphatase n=1 Tax=Nocardia sp. NPDC049190 TaxID=3155650 RepID=UPI0033EFEF58
MRHLGLGAGSVWFNRPPGSEDASAGDGSAPTGIPPQHHGSLPGHAGSVEFSLFRATLLAALRRVGTAASKQLIRALANTPEPALRSALANLTDDQQRVVGRWLRGDRVLDLQLDRAIRHVTRLLAPSEETSADDRPGVALLDRAVAVVRQARDEKPWELVVGLRRLAERSPTQLRCVEQVALADPLRKPAAAAAELGIPVHDFVQHANDGLSWLARFLFPGARGKDIVLVDDARIHYRAQLQVVLEELREHHAEQWRSVTLRLRTQPAKPAAELAAELKISLSSFNTRLYYGTRWVAERLAREIGAVQVTAPRHIDGAGEASFDGESSTDRPRNEAVAAYDRLRSDHPAARHDVQCLPDAGRDAWAAVGVAPPADLVEFEADRLDGVLVKDAAGVLGAGWNTDITVLMGARARAAAGDAVVAVFVHEPEPGQVAEWAHAVVVRQNSVGDVVVFDPVKGVETPFEDYRTPAHVAMLAMVVTRDGPDPAFVPGQPLPAVVAAFADVRIGAATPNATAGDVAELSTQPLQGPPDPRDGAEVVRWILGSSSVPMRWHRGAAQLPDEVLLASAADPNIDLDAIRRRWEELEVDYRQSGWRSGGGPVLRGDPRTITAVRRKGLLPQQHKRDGMVVHTTVRGKSAGDNGKSVTVDLATSDVVVLHRIHVIDAPGGFGVVDEDGSVYSVHWPGGLRSERVMGCFEIPAEVWQGVRGDFAALADELPRYWQPNPGYRSHDGGPDLSAPETGDEEGSAGSELYGQLASPSQLPILTRPEEVARARRHVRELMRGWQSDQVDHAELLVSELGSRIVDGGRVGVLFAEVTGEQGARVLRVETFGSVGESESVIRAGEPVRREWALELLDALSQRSGRGNAGGFESVWFELAEAVPPEATAADVGKLRSAVVRARELLEGLLAELSPLRRECVRRRFLADSPMSFSAIAVDLGIDEKEVDRLIRLGVKSDMLRSDVVDCRDQFAVLGPELAKLGRGEWYRRVMVNLRRLARVAAIARFARHYDAVTSPDDGELAGGITGRVDRHGILYVTARVAEGTPSGAVMFGHLMDAVGDHVRVIHARWVNRPEFTSNLDTFNDGIKRRLSPIDAALLTFTGKMAVRAGYTEPEIRTLTGTPGEYVCVEVRFSRPSSETPADTVTPGAELREDWDLDPTFIEVWERYSGAVRVAVGWSYSDRALVTALVDEVEELARHRMPLRERGADPSGWLTCLATVVAKDPLGWASRVRRALVAELPAADRVVVEPILADASATVLAHAVDCLLPGRREVIDLLYRQPDSLWEIGFEPDLIRGVVADVVAAIVDVKPIAPLHAGLGDEKAPADYTVEQLEVLERVRTGAMLSDSERLVLASAVDNLRQRLDGNAELLRRAESYLLGPAERLLAGESATATVLVPEEWLPAWFRESGSTGVIADGPAVEVVSALRSAVRSLAADESVAADYLRLRIAGLSALEAVEVMGLPSWPASGPNRGGPGWDLHRGAMAKVAPVLVQAAAISDRELRAVPTLLVYRAWPLLPRVVRPLTEHIVSGKRALPDAAEMAEYWELPVRDGVFPATVARLGEICLAEWAPAVAVPAQFGPTTTTALRALAAELDPDRAKLLRLLLWLLDERSTAPKSHSDPAIMRLDNLVFPPDSGLQSVLLEAQRQDNPLALGLGPTLTESPRSATQTTPDGRSQVPATPRSVPSDALRPSRYVRSPWADRATAALPDPRAVRGAEVHSAKKAAAALAAGAAWESLSRGEIDALVRARPADVLATDAPWPVWHAASMMLLVRDRDKLRDRLRYNLALEDEQEPTTGVFARHRAQMRADVERRRVEIDELLRAMVPAEQASALTVELLENADRLQARSDSDPVYHRLRAAGVERVDELSSAVAYYIGAAWVLATVDAQSAHRASRRTSNPTDSTGDGATSKPREGGGMAETGPKVNFHHDVDPAEMLDVGRLAQAGRSPEGGIPKALENLVRAVLCTQGVRVRDPRGDNRSGKPAPMVEVVEIGVGGAEFLVLKVEVVDGSEPRRKVELHLSRGHQDRVDRVTRLIEQMMPDWGRDVVVRADDRARLAAEHMMRFDDVTITVEVTGHHGARQAIVAVDGDYERMELRFDEAEGKDEADGAPVEWSMESDRSLWLSPVTRAQHTFIETGPDGVSLVDIRQRLVASDLQVRYALKWLSLQQAIEHDGVDTSVDSVVALRGRYPNLMQANPILDRLTRAADVALHQDSGGDARQFLWHGLPSLSEADEAAVRYVAQLVRPERVAALIAALKGVAPMHLLGARLRDLQQILELMTRNQHERELSKYAPDLARAWKQPAPAQWVWQVPGETRTDLDETRDTAAAGTSEPPARSSAADVEPGRSARGVSYTENYGRMDVVGASHPALADPTKTEPGTAPTPSAPALEHGRIEGQHVAEGDAVVPPAESGDETTTDTAASGQGRNQYGPLELLRRLRRLNPNITVPENTGTQRILVSEFAQHTGARQVLVRQFAVGTDRPHQRVVDAFGKLVNSTSRSQREGMSVVVFDGFHKAVDGVQGIAFRLVYRAGAIRLDGLRKGVNGRFRDTMTVDERANLKGVWALAFDRDGHPIRLSGIDIGGLTTDFTIGVAVVRAGAPEPPLRRPHGRGGPPLGPGPVGFVDGPGVWSDAPLRPRRGRWRPDELATFNAATGDGSSPGDAFRARGRGRVPVDAELREILDVETVAANVAAGFPAHRTLVEVLTAAILDGRLEAGRPMPSAAGLGAACGMSAATVGQVYAELRRSHLLRSHQGSGTVVADYAELADSPVAERDSDLQVDVVDLLPIVAGCADVTALTRAIEAAILNGRLAPNRLLPGVKDVAESIGVSRSTAARAYSRLRRDGLLKSLDGVGTVVAARHEVAHRPIAAVDSEHDETHSLSKDHQQPKPQAETENSPASLDQLRERFEAEVAERMAARYPKAAGQLVAEVFRRAQTRIGELDEFEEIEEIRLWVMSITNGVLAHHDKFVRHMRFRAAVEAAAQGAERDALARASHRDFRNAVAALSRGRRLVLMRRFIDGMSTEAIAETMGLGAKAVREMVPEILRELAVKLGAELGEDEDDWSSTGGEALADLLESGGVALAMSKGPLAPAITVLRAVSRDARRDELCFLVEQLSPMDRDTFVRWWSGETARDIARPRTDKPSRQSVRQRLLRVVPQLAVGFGDDQADDDAGAFPKGDALAQLLATGGVSLAMSKRKLAPAIAVLRAAARDERLDKLRLLVQRLPPSSRDIFIRWWLGEAVLAIAETVNLTQNGVEWHLRRLVLQLAVKLGMELDKGQADDNADAFPVGPALAQLLASGGVELALSKGALAPAIAALRVARDEDLDELRVLVEELSPLGRNTFVRWWLGEAVSGIAATDHVTVHAVQLRLHRLVPDLAERLGGGASADTARRAGPAVKGRSGRSGVVPSARVVMDGTVPLPVPVVNDSGPDQLAPDTGALPGRVPIPNDFGYADPADSREERALLGRFRASILAEMRSARPDVPDDDPRCRALRDADRGRVWSAVSGLTEQQREYLRGWFLERTSLRALAQRLGLRRSGPEFLRLQRETVADLVNAIAADAGAEPWTALRELPEGSETASLAPTLGDDSNGVYEEFENIDDPRVIEAVLSARLGCDAVGFGLRRITKRAAREFPQAIVDMCGAHSEIEVRGGFAIGAQKRDVRVVAGYVQSEVTGPAYTGSVYTQSVGLSERLARDPALAEGVVYDKTVRALAESLNIAGQWRAAPLALERLRRFHDESGQGQRLSFGDWLRENFDEDCFQSKVTDSEHAFEPSWALSSSFAAVEVGEFTDGQRVLYLLLVEQARIWHRRDAYSPRIPIEEAVASAEASRAVGAALLAEFGILTVGLDAFGMDPRAVQQVDAALRDVYRLHREIDANVIRVDGRPAEVYATTVGTGSITLGARWARNPRYFERANQDDIDAKFHRGPSDRAWYLTFVHELMHAFHFQSWNVVTFFLLRLDREGVINELRKEFSTQPPAVRVRTFERWLGEQFTGYSFAPDKELARSEALQKGLIEAYAEAGAAVIPAILEEMRRGLPEENADIVAILEKLPEGRTTLGERVLYRRLVRQVRATAARRRTQEWKTILAEAAGARGGEPLGPHARLFTGAVPYIEVFTGIGDDGRVMDPRLRAALERQGIPVIEIQVDETGTVFSEESLESFIDRLRNRDGTVAQHAAAASAPWRAVLPVLAEHLGVAEQLDDLRALFELTRRLDELDRRIADLLLSASDRAESVAQRGDLRDKWRRLAGSLGIRSGHVGSDNSDPLPHRLPWHVVSLVNRVADLDSQIAQANDVLACRRAWPEIFEAVGAEAVTPFVGFSEKKLRDDGRPDKIVVTVLRPRADSDRGQLFEYDYSIESALCDTEFATMLELAENVELRYIAVIDEAEYPYPWRDPESLISPVDTDGTKWNDAGVKLRLFDVARPEMRRGEDGNFEVRWSNDDARWRKLFPYPEKEPPRAQIDPERNRAEMERRGQSRDDVVRRRREVEDEWKLLARRLGIAPEDLAPDNLGKLGQQALDRFEALEILHAVLERADQWETEWGTRSGRRQLSLARVPNARDIGGLPTGDGKRTRFGVLFRSSTPQYATESDVRKLLDLGIDMVLDLRTPEQSLEGGHGLLPGAGIQCANLPITTDGKLPRGKQNFTKLYFQSLTSKVSAQSIVRTVRYLIDPEQRAVMIHCIHGRDRTGILIALLLAAVGVRTEAIVHDYALTNANLHRLKGLPGNWGRATEPVALRRLLEFLDQQGGAPAFLRSLGVTDAEIALLRDVLIEPTTGSATAHPKDPQPPRPAPPTRNVEAEEFGLASAPGSGGVENSDVPDFGREPSPGGVDGTRDIDGRSDSRDLGSDAGFTTSGRDLELDAARGESGGLPSATDRTTAQAALTNAWDVANVFRGLHTVGPESPADSPQPPLSTPWTGPTENTRPDAGQGNSHATGAAEPPVTPWNGRKAPKPFDAAAFADALDLPITQARNLADSPPAPNIRRGEKPFVGFAKDPNLGPDAWADGPGENGEPESTSPAPDGDRTDRAPDTAHPGPSTGPRNPETGCPGGRSVPRETQGSADPPSNGAFLRELEDHPEPGKWIEAQRKKLGLIEKDFARAIDISVKRRKIILGAARPGLETFRKVCSYLSLSGDQQRVVLQKFYPGELVSFHIHPVEHGRILTSWLTAYLMHRGWTQLDLARAMGMDRGQLGRYFTGKYTPRLETFRAICVAMDVPDELQRQALRQFYNEWPETFSLDPGDHTVFGSWLTACRASLGWSHQQVVDATGLHYNTIKLMEWNNRQRFRMETLEKLREGLELDNDRFTELVHHFGLDDSSRDSAAAPHKRGFSSPTPLMRSPELEMLAWCRRRADLPAGVRQSVAEYLYMNDLSQQQARRWLTRAEFDSAIIDADEQPGIIPDPRGFDSERDWATSLRDYLALDPERMDDLTDSPYGSWRNIEDGKEDLTTRQLRALLRRIPRAHGLYFSCDEQFPRHGLVHNGRAVYPEGYMQQSLTSPGDPRIGEYLRNRRVSAGLSQSELANKAGENMTIGRISAYETGQVPFVSMAVVESFLGILVPDRSVTYDEVGECFDYLPRKELLIPSPHAAESLGEYVPYFRRVNRLRIYEVKDILGVDATAELLGRGAGRSASVLINSRTADFLMLHVYETFLHMNGRWEWNDYAEAWGYRYRIDPTGEKLPDPGRAESASGWVYSTRLFYRLTQKKLAELTGVPVRTMANAETIHPPSLVMLRRLRDATNEDEKLRSRGPITDEMLDAVLLHHYAHEGVSPSEGREAQLLKDYFRSKPRSGKEIAARTRVEDEFTWIAFATAARYRYETLEFSERVSVAMEAIIRAIPFHNPLETFKSHAWASAKIALYSAHLDIKYSNISDNTPYATNLIRLLVDKIARYIARYQQDHQGRSPKDTDIAAALGIELAEVTRAHQLLGTAKPWSLDEPLRGKGGNMERTLHDTVADDSTSETDTDEPDTDAESATDFSNDEFDTVPDEFELKLRAALADLSDDDYGFVRNLIELNLVGDVPLGDAIARLDPERERDREAVVRLLTNSLDKLRTAFSKFRPAFQQGTSADTASQRSPQLRSSDSLTNFSRPDRNAQDTFTRTLTALRDIGVPLTDASTHETWWQDLEDATGGQIRPVSFDPADGNYAPTYAVADRLLDADDPLDAAAVLFDDGNGDYLRLIVMAGIHPDPNAALPGPRVVGGRVHPRTVLIPRVVVYDPHTHGPMEFATWIDPNLEPDPDPDFYNRHRNPYGRIRRAWIIGYTVDLGTRTLDLLHEPGYLYPADIPPNLPFER